jgi:DNA mismatch endonuclease (patch repair protein)
MGADRVGEHSVRRLVESSSPAASNRMRANRRRDTKPEMALRAELHRRGCRFRVDLTVLPARRADVVFTKARVAVFVDGCFWHGCPEHATVAKANAEFWQAKIGANRARDCDTTLRLEAVGWTMVRVWEHEDIGTAADRVQAALRSANRSKTI